MKDSTRGRETEVTLDAADAWAATANEDAEDAGVPCRFRGSEEPCGFAPGFKLNMRSPIRLAVIESQAERKVEFRRLLRADPTPLANVVAAFLRRGVRTALLAMERRSAPRWLNTLLERPYQSYFDVFFSDQNSAYIMSEFVRMFIAEALFSYFCSDVSTA